MKIDKDLTAIALAIALAATVACQTAGNKNSAVIVNANRPTNTSTNAAPPASSNVAGTPSEAYKAAYDARKNKDVPALKRMLSKDILEFFTSISGMGEKKQTIDELLMELCERPQAATAETRNEKINGEKASVEYLDEKGGWSPMEFIKEDGAWKLTIEKPEKGDIEIDNGANKNSNRKQ